MKAMPSPPEMPVTTTPTQSNTALNILFLSSDTGGGHRASAESLAGQFVLQFPGSKYNLLDVMSDHGVPPYNSIIRSYKHLSAHPTQWKVVYNFTNFRASELIFDAHSKLMCERAIRKRIKSYDPDVVVSVHPMMTNVPALACHKISKETGKHLPMYTVVTDLGSGHCLWFANGVDKMFIASEEIQRLAKMRGKVPDEKLVMAGLPIRHDFSAQAMKLGDRNSDSGREYQRRIRAELGLSNLTNKFILVMGGGEGVGSLSNIVNALYCELTQRGIHATLLVVCGRNIKLKTDLECRNWAAVLNNKLQKKSYFYSVPSISSCLTGNIVSISSSPITTNTSQYPSSTFSFSTSLFGTEAGCFDGGVTHQLRKMLSTSTFENAVVSPLPDDSSQSDDSNDTPDHDHLRTDLNHSNMDLAPFVLPESNDVTRFEIADDFLSTLPQSTTTIALTPECPERHGGISSSGVIFNEDEDDDDDQYENDDNPPPNKTLINPGKVEVKPLGFVTRMAEFMVASDILVSKAGPGTIAEAASVGLPIVLTSFLPGQEEGNVDYVVNGEFGSYCNDSDPMGVAEEVASWLLDEKKMQILSENARRCGKPNAAAEIVKCIGEETLNWKKINGSHGQDCVALASSSSVTTKDELEDEEEEYSADGSDSNY